MTEVDAVSPAETGDAANQYALDRNDVTRALAGDASAFQRLVEGYYCTVHAVACSVVRDGEVGEEVAQEAFLRAYLGLRELKRPETFAVWVHRICRNLGKDWLRRRRTRSQFVQIVSEQAIPVSEIADSRIPDARSRIDAERETAELHAAVCRLPGDLREVLLMHFTEGLHPAEIARRLLLNRCNEIESVRIRSGEITSTVVNLGR